VSGPLVERFALHGPFRGENEITLTEREVPLRETCEGKSSKISPLVDVVKRGVDRLGGTLSIPLRPCQHGKTGQGLRDERSWRRRRGGKRAFQPLPAFPEIAPNKPESDEGSCQAQRHHVFARRPEPAERRV
jgi:hypothetical protein